jgi:uracil-DNA glycosylase
VVRPTIIVCLGATAAQAMLGKSFRVTLQRGQMLSSEAGPLITATVHPSSILRAPDDEGRRREMDLFVADLRKVASVLRESKAA